MGSNATRRRSAGAFMLLVVVGCVMQSGLLKDAKMSLFDLSIYLDASEAVFHGSNALYTGRWGPGWPFTYPPFSALAMMPAAILPHKLATVLFTLVSVVSLGRISWLIGDALAMRWIARVPKAEEFSAYLVAGAAAVIFLSSLASDPVRGTLAFGQINIVVAWLVIEDFLGKHKASGLLTGVAASVKVIPAFLLVGKLLSGDRTFFYRGAFSAALCLLFSAICLPHETYDYFFTYLWDTSRVGQIWVDWNQSITGSCMRLFHGSGVEHPISLFFSAVAAVAGLIAGVVLSRRGDRVGSVLTLFLCSGIVSPISWYHHFVLLPAFCIWLALESAHWPRLYRIICRIEAVVLFCWSEAGLYQLVPRSNGDELHHSLRDTLIGEAQPWLSLAALVTLAVVSWVVLRQQREGGAHSERANGTPGR